MGGATSVTSSRPCRAPPLSGTTDALRQIGACVASRCSSNMRDGPQCWEQVRSVGFGMRVCLAVADLDLTVIDESGLGLSARADPPRSRVGSTWVLTLADAGHFVCSAIDVSEDRAIMAPSESPVRGLWTRARPWAAGARRWPSQVTRHRGGRDGPRAVAAGPDESGVWRARLAWRCDECVRSAAPPETFRPGRCGRHLCDHGHDRVDWWTANGVGVSGRGRGAVSRATMSSFFWIGTVMSLVALRLVGRFGEDETSAHTADASKCDGRGSVDISVDVGAGRPWLHPAGGADARGRRRSGGDCAAVVLSGKLTSEQSRGVDIARFDRRPRLIGFVS